jgi:LCP family protein required for cell wall assembly
VHCQGAARVVWWDVRVTELPPSDRARRPQLPLPLPPARDASAAARDASAADAAAAAAGAAAAAAAAAPDAAPGEPKAPRRTHRRRRIVVGVASVVVLLLVVAVGAVAITILNVNSGIHRSAIGLPVGKPGPAQAHGAENILIMGLDSRVDENGQPYPQAIYNAIHAEDASVGGYNTNVLMYVHIPAGGGPAVGVSIPRDDYVRYAGAPGGVQYGKIKEAYGRELAADESTLLGKGVPRAQAYQQARDAAREEEIQTVSQFLGGVPINHFVEITMAAFYQIAQAVQPITVCLNHATADPNYSGANFPAGVQQVNAAQAMAFVRQRRDTVYQGVNLSDLDRTRRQQAFMVSLALKLRQAQTFSNFGTLQKLIDTAKQYIALDQGFDLLTLAADMQRLAGGDITFQTLPIVRFGYIGGESVNIVNQPQIAQQVATLLNPPTPTPVATPVPSASSTHSSPAGAKPAPRPTMTSYTDAEQPMRSGSVPCVN